MPKTITTSVGGLSDTGVRSALTEIQGVADTLLSTGGLVIHGSASTLAKVATLCKALVNGVLVSIAANTDMPALVGSVTNTKFNVFCFYINSTGTVSVLMGTEGATIGAIVFPTTPADNACIGFVIINPTGTGAFVGGTTALDDATVVPNAVYVNTPFPFVPNILGL